MIEASVLVLNKLYQAIHITTVRRAFCLLAKGHVRVVAPDLRTYTFEEWLLLEPGENEESVVTPTRRLAVMRVVLLIDFDRIPRREVKFSRRNVYLRDGCRCQYCGRKLPMSDLNLDHVIPISRGGKSTWENVVSSCIGCNSRKRNRYPEEAGLTLLRRPERPRWQAFFGATVRDGIHESWKTFLLTPVLAAER
ncbi:MAG: HNH endonuclease [Acidobacteriota bacterium]